MIPQVVVSERGGAQTVRVEARAGLKDRDTGEGLVGEAPWEGAPQGVRVPYPKPNPAAAES